MARIEREKANQRDLTRLTGFVAEHGLSCYRCGLSQGTWARTGVSKAGPWAICMACLGSSAPNGRPLR